MLCSKRTAAEFILSVLPLYKTANSIPTLAFGHAGKRNLVRWN